MHVHRGVPRAHRFYTHLFLFLLFFAMFCVDIVLFFNSSFLYFLFMFTIFGIPDIERRKKKEESSLRPATRIFVRNRWFVVFICLNLKLTFSCSLPTWRLIPDQYKWCIAAAANAAFGEGNCRYSPVPSGCVSSRACTSIWLGAGFCCGWVESKRAVVFCRCGWRMEWKVLVKGNEFVSSPN